MFYCKGTPPVKKNVFFRALHELPFPPQFHINCEWFESVCSIFWIELGRVISGFGLKSVTVRFLFLPQLTIGSKMRLHLFFFILFLRLFDKQLPLIASQSLTKLLLDIKVTWEYVWKWNTLKQSDKEPRGYLNVTFYPLPDVHCLA